jgi:hypothetical protein
MVEELYQAIHITDNINNPKFIPSSDAVSKGYQSDNLVDYSYYYNYMIKENYPFIVGAGELDIRDGAVS